MEIYVFEISFNFSIESLLNSKSKYTAVPDVVEAYEACTFFKFELSNKISFVSSLDDADFWNTIAKDKSIKHIVYYSLPDQTDMYSITKWALDNDKTVNNFYFARTLGNHIIANRNKALK